MVVLLIHTRSGSLYERRVELLGGKNVIKQGYRRRINKINSRYDTKQIRMSTRRYRRFQLLWLFQVIWSNICDCKWRLTAFFAQFDFWNFCSCAACKQNINQRQNKQQINIPPYKEVRLKRHFALYSTFWTASSSSWSLFFELIIATNLTLVDCRRFIFSANYILDKMNNLRRWTPTISTK